MRLHGQAVKTPPFHGGNRGSIPLGVTIPGLLTRYFFGESSPCYAYCFAIRTGFFCSALALRRGSVYRFKRLVWASLRLSERSRTIEVRVTTLSPLARLKLLGSVYPIGSFLTLIMRFCRHCLSVLAVAMLLACLSLNKAQK